LILTYLSKKKQKLNDLILRTVAETRTRDFSDFHITEYESKFEKSENRISNALSVLQDTLELLGEVDDFVLGIGFSLKGEKDLVGINFHNQDELERELDGSPPSIYFFKSRHDFGANKLVKINSKVLNKEGFREYYCEFLSPHDHEVRRSFFLIREKLEAK
jgi:hypothetical protein